MQIKWRQHGRISPRLLSPSPPRLCSSLCMLTRGAVCKVWVKRQFHACVAAAARAPRGKTATSLRAPLTPTAHPLFQAHLAVPALRPAPLVFHDHARADAHTTAKSRDAHDAWAWASSGRGPLTRFRADLASRAKGLGGCRIRIAAAGNRPATPPHGLLHPCVAHRQLHGVPPQTSKLRVNVDVRTCICGACARSN